MRIHASWGRMARDAAPLVGLPATARASELAGSSNGLTRARSSLDLPGSGYDAVRSAIAELRWFPDDFLRAVMAPDGVTVLQRCRVAPFVCIDAPVRIVDRVDEPHRVAVTVVTVAGHPERGVERYSATRDPALDRVTVTVEKAWVLADRLARLAGPFSNWFQGHATRRSLARFRRLGGVR